MRADPPRRLDDRGIVEVPAFGFAYVERRDVEAPSEASGDESAEHRRRIESREAQPVDRTGRRDERGRPRVSDQSVLADRCKRRRIHSVSRTPSGRETAHALGIFRHTDHGDQKERTMAKIAFLGLGQMGAPMAARMLDAGHDVTVWNRTQEKAEPLGRRGARIASAPDESIAGADVAITMLSDPDAVERVVFGHGGLAAALEPRQ